MIKAVIFDLDGVIVNTAQYHYLAWKQVANNLGFDISEEQNEQLKGISRIKSLDIIMSWGNVKINQIQKDKLLIEKNKNYLKYISTLNPSDILPGIINTLNYLKSKYIAIALGSASKNAVTILEKLQIVNLFDAIVDGNVVKKAKPNPEVFLKAAHKLNITPKNCVVIEDAKAGVAAANNAKMLSIGIGSKSNLFQADYVLEDTAKLPDFLADILLIK